VVEDLDAAEDDHAEQAETEQQQDRPLHPEQISTPF
jgi:hypothetical protein